MRIDVESDFYLSSIFASFQSSVCTTQKKNKKSSVWAVLHYAYWDPMTWKSLRVCFFLVTKAIIELLFGKAKLSGKLLEKYVYSFLNFVILSI